jgi:hypothetical protein
VRADIPGGIFPDYELTDHTKTQRPLSELQGIDPMIPYRLAHRRGRSSKASTTIQEMP